MVARNVSFINCLRKVSWVKPLKLLSKPLLDCRPPSYQSVRTNINRIIPEEACDGIGVMAVDCIHRIAVTADQPLRDLLVSQRQLCLLTNWLSAESHGSKLCKQEVD